MKSLLTSMVYFFFAILFVLFIFSGCGNTVTNNPVTKPTGNMKAISDCKLKVTYQKALEDTGKNKDCIDYQWDGKGTLTFKHVNAAFNCCPDSILAAIHIDSLNITIDEKEITIHHACECDCLYDIDYVFHDLKPGTYTITINEPHKPVVDSILQIDINLQNSALSGSFCFVRHGEPWWY